MPCIYINFINVVTVFVTLLLPFSPEKDLTPLPAKRSSRLSAMIAFEQRHQEKTQLREKELLLREKELEFQREKLQLEEEARQKRWELEQAERKQRMEIEREERKMFLELLQKHLNN